MASDSKGDRKSPSVGAAQSPRTNLECSVCMEAYETNDSRGKLPRNFPCAGQPCRLLSCLIAWWCSVFSGAHVLQLVRTGVGQGRLSSLSKLPRGPHPGCEGSSHQHGAAELH